MSKVEIAGPKEHLLATLVLLREMGVFQVEPGPCEGVEGRETALVKSLAYDEKSVAERLFLEGLRQKIDQLLACLPRLPVRKSYLEPLAVLDIIAADLATHGEFAATLCRKREELVGERQDLERHAVFLGSLEGLLAGVETRTGLDFIGVTIREPAVMERLVQLLERLTAGRFELLTTPAEDGSVIGLITMASGESDKVKRALQGERVPELTFPASCRDLPFPERVRFIADRLQAIAAETAAIDGELEQFARRWLTIYLRVREWLDERLLLLRTTACVQETGMCFLVHGWLPSAEFAGLSDRLTARFSGQVVAEERQLLEQDLEKVPVALRNPAYFRPFELIARLLPLPRYTSYDPTPFIGIFFPIFFGMMLGDAGHGLLLAAVVPLLLWRYRKRQNVADAARILGVCAFCTILFGLAYGEFFGELGSRLFGLKAFGIARATAILPMLYFTVTVGIAHVTLGLFLGFLAALRHGTGREAVFKLLNIAVILCLAALFASWVVPSPWLLSRPILITAALLVPFLFITGGLLAPLELLKHIGNIISYTRIMAIGLSSVLLANVANHLAGATGDVVLGVLGAVVLHTINLVLGVFAPTIHALRLHFVEFFSKFMETGGRRFEPLKK